MHPYQQQQKKYDSSDLLPPFSCKERLIFKQVLCDIGLTATMQPFKIGIFFQFTSWIISRVTDFKLSKKGDEGKGLLVAKR